MFYRILFICYVMAFSSVCAAGKIDFENALWKMFTYTGNITSIVSSDGGEILWVGSSGGLEKLDADTGLRLQLWTVLDGLPSNQVKCLAQDGDGGLWIGTDDGGLAHMHANGELKTYSQDSSDLPSDIVSCLASDNQGGLWIGTYGSGLAHLSSGGTWTVYQSDNSGLPDNDVESLSLDGNGGLWIGTSGGGVAHLDADDLWRVYDTTHAGLPGNYAINVASDSQGGLWIAMLYDGLVHLSGEDTATIYQSDNSGLPSDRVQILSPDGNGGLWIGTQEGLAHLNAEGSWRVYDSSNSDLPSEDVEIIFADDQGNLWIAADGKLAYLDTTGEWTTYVTGNSGLPGSFAGSLSPDGTGGVWLNTYAGIANLAPNGVWKLLDRDELLENSASGFVSDSQGGLWVRTPNGRVPSPDPPYYFRYVKGKILHLSATGELIPVYTVLDLNGYCSDGQGGLWMGIGGSSIHHGVSWGALEHLDADGNLTTYGTESGLPHYYVVSIASDGQGGVWACTWGGLAHFTASGEWEVYTTDYSGSRISCDYGLLPDYQGGIWIGRDGLHLSAAGDWAFVDKVIGIRDVCRDGQSGQWIGTSSGLVHWDGGIEWAVYTKNNSGMPIHYVDSIALDGEGRLWLASGDTIVHTSSASDTFQNRLPVYRFFSTQTNAHFYTTDPLERDQIVVHYNWFRYEGIAYYVIDSIEQTSNVVPVYRFYNTQSGSHFFTIHEAEKNAIIAQYDGFRYEGIAWYAYATEFDAPQEAMPVYRFFNTQNGSHFFTIDEAEKDTIIAHYNWFRYEGVAWYAYLNK